MKEDKGVVVSKQSSRDLNTKAPTTKGCCNQKFLNLSSEHKAKADPNKKT